MLSLAHTLISLPLGIYFQNPLLIFITAVLLHFVCDMILHWNIYLHHYKKFPYIQVALDVIAGPLIAYLFIGQDLFTIPVLAAIAGGNTPDIIHTLWEMSKKRRWPWLKPFFHWHHNIQVETNDLLIGLTPQLTLAALSLVLALTAAG